MKNLLIMSWLILLFGCGDDLSSVREFVKETQEHHKPMPESLPDFPEFSHIKYHGEDTRSPFSKPEPE